MDSDQVVLKNEALMETSDLLRIALHKKISRNAPASAIERLSDAIIRVEEALLEMTRSN